MKCSVTESAGMVDRARPFSIKISNSYSKYIDLAGLLGLDMATKGKQLHHRFYTLKALGHSYARVYLAFCLLYFVRRVYSGVRSIPRPCVVGPFESIKPPELSMIPPSPFRVGNAIYHEIDT